VRKCTCFHFTNRGGVYRIKRCEEKRLVCLGRRQGKEQYRYNFKQANRFDGHSVKREQRYRVVGGFIGRFFRYFFAEHLIAGYFVAGCFIAGYLVAGYLIAEYLIAEYFIGYTVGYSLTARNAGGR